MIACSVWPPTARSSVAAAADVVDAVTPTWLKELGPVGVERDRAGGGNLVREDVIRLGEVARADGPRVVDA